MQKSNRTFEEMHASIRKNLAELDRMIEEDEKEFKKENAKRKQEILLSSKK